MPGQLSREPLQRMRVSECDKERQSERDTLY